MLFRSASKSFTVDVDGNSASTTYTYSLVNPSATYFTIGNFATTADGNGTSLLGGIRQIKTVKRRLSDLEIAELFKRMRGSYPYP